MHCQVLYNMLLWEPKLTQTFGSHFPWPFLLSLFPIYPFIWLPGLSHSMQTLSWVHVGSVSDQDQTLGSCIGSVESATRPPCKPLSSSFLLPHPLHVPWYFPGSCPRFLFSFLWFLSLSDLTHSQGQLLFLDQF